MQPVQRQHAFLDLARERRWDQLMGMLEEDAGLVNVQPAGRWSALHQAALVGDEGVVRRLLDFKADVNVKTKEGQKPVEIACEGPVKALLTHAGRTKKRQPDAYGEADEANEAARKKARVHKADVLSLPDLPGVGSARPLERRPSLSSEDQRLRLEQQVIRTHVDSFWRAIKEGNAELILTHIRQRPEVLLERGSLGETPLHMLLLHQHLAIAGAIAERYPRLLLDEYAGQYEGENCLHLAIVGRGVTFVRSLLDIARNAGILEELLAARATGPFFERGKPWYFGTSPLHLAVSVGVTQIVREMVLTYGASMEVEDAYGNNLLHLVVKHRLPEMYDVVSSLWDDWKSHAKDPDTHLSDRKNKEGLTPLCAAAKYGYADIFVCMLQQRCTVDWSFGPVTSVLLPLEDLDSVSGVTTGAIEHIIQEGHLNLLMLPLVQELLQRKWEDFAEALFLRNLYQAAARALLFTVMVVLDPDSSQDDLDPLYLWFLRQLVHWACKVVLVVTTTRKFRVELRELMAKGIEQYPGCRGALLFENLLSSSYILCFMLALVLSPFGSALADPPLAMAGLLSWVYLLWFLLGFSDTGHLVVMLWTILTGDMVRFAWLTVIVIMGFSVAFFIAMTDPLDRGPSTFRAQIFNCLHMMTSGFDKAEGERGDSMVSSLLSSLLLSYTVISTVLMLNVLIAMMNDTYNKVSEVTDQQWKLERARIILSIEQELDPAEREQFTYVLAIEGKKFCRLEQVDWARS